MRQMIQIDSCTKAFVLGEKKKKAGSCRRKEAVDQIAYIRTTTKSVAYNKIISLVS